MTNSDEQSEPLTLRAQTAHGEPRANRATIATRVYFSSYHLWTARHLSGLAAEMEKAPGRVPRFDIEHRAYVTGSILSAVAFAEGAINELFQDVADGHEGYFATLDPEARRLITGLWEMTEGRNRSPFSILDKYQLALTLVQKPQFPVGEAIYQDADLAIKLRNALTHYKPVTSSEDNPGKLAARLNPKFKENPLMAGAGNPYFPDKCLGSPCALWCVTAMKRLADAFFSQLGVSPNYQRVNFDQRASE